VGPDVGLSVLNDGDCCAGDIEEISEIVPAFGQRVQLFVVTDWESVDSGLGEQRRRCRCEGESGKGGKLGEAHGGSFFYQFVVVTL